MPKKSIILILTALCFIKTEAMNQKQELPSLKEISALAYLESINKTIDIPEQIEAENIPAELKEYLMDINFKDLMKEINESVVPFSKENAYDDNQRQILIDIIRGKDISKKISDMIDIKIINELARKNSALCKKAIENGIMLNTDQHTIAQILLPEFNQEVQNYIIAYLCKELAMPFSHKQIINLLLNRWILYSTDYDRGLLLAAINGNLEAVSKLFPRASADAQRGALIGATQFEHNEVVQLLLNNNVDVNIGNDNDNALVWAVQRGNLTIAILLIEYGATITNEVMRMRDFNLSSAGKYLGHHEQISEIINFAVLPETQELIKNGTAKEIGLLNLMKLDK